MHSVIFDMDGLLIDSEPMWQAAEKQVFSSLGVNVTEELSALTAAMTTREVTEFWFQQSPWDELDPVEAENAVIDTVAMMIQSEGKAMPGVAQALELCRHQGCKIGLATNAPYRLIPVVLQKLDIESYFDSIVSAEQVAHGKPRPDVYLQNLEQLQTTAADTIAFEDSMTGLKAAVQAGIKTVIVPSGLRVSSQFDQADLCLNQLSEFNESHFWQLCKQ